MKAMLDEYEKGFATQKSPAPRFLNHQKGVFTFVHVAESRKEAIANGAAKAALWYVHAAPIAFKVPRSIWWDTIRVDSQLPALRTLRKYDSQLSPPSRSHAWNVLAQGLSVIEEQIREQGRECQAVLSVLAPKQTLLPLLRE